MQATNPLLDMMTMEGSKDTLLRDCYLWILESEELKKWRGETGNTSLWIRGDPGKGKTMLMMALVRELSKQFKGTDTAVIFFFCRHR